jgi:predicted O-methyltransferase YrrM
MIFFRGIKYLKYILLSGHRKGHGIHSPFVFDLVSRVFRNKTDHNIVCTIEKIRNEMLRDFRSVTVKDLGAGSERLKSNERKVSEIARYSLVPEKYGVLLSNMAAVFGKSYILELGTSLGISTMYMASASLSAKVTTIEGSPATAEIAKEYFMKAKLKNIEVVTGSFHEVLPAILNSTYRPGLVFIDGDHRKESLKKYFSQIAELSDDNTVVIIDDIYNSVEMEEAWNEIKRDEKVSVTVDIFRMGVVFFRGGINHNNYVIRY